MKSWSKEFRITLLILVILIASVILWNLVRHWLVQRAIASSETPTTVTADKAQLTTWRPYLTAVGTLNAIQGVSVSTQAAGNVVCINFNSGQYVKKDDLLIQIDDRAEQAQLQNLQAALKLAELGYFRNKQLALSNTISRQAFDEATARFQQAIANVAQTEATIHYKHITAPFDGRIGIRLVNLGQYVRPGDNMVSLQMMDPLYVNFFLPEKFLHRLHINQSVTVRVDAAPKLRFRGKINALDSLVDVQTHNISVQATLSNKDLKLYPGLFARIQVELPARSNIVTIPQTAINYTLRGNTVFVIKKTGKDKNGHDILIARLREIDTGDQRDNKVVINKGLKAGETVVTSGQLTLTNGDKVIINNQVKP
jgi:membrane fusion protein (multidrug efflux system)